MRGDRVRHYKRCSAPGCSTFVKVKDDVHDKCDSCRSGNQPRSADKTLEQLSDAISVSTGFESRKRKGERDTGRMVITRKQFQQLGKLIIEGSKASEKIEKIEKSEGMKHKKGKVQGKGELDDIQQIVEQCRRGNKKKVLKFFQDHPSTIFWETPTNTTFLHLAVEGGNVDVVKYILDHWGNSGNSAIANSANSSKVNHQNDEGDTALHLAMRKGKQNPMMGVIIMIVKLLVEHGANMTSVKNKKGLTPKQEGIKSFSSFSSFSQTELTQATKKKLLSILSELQEIQRSHAAR